MRKLLALLPLIALPAAAQEVGSGTPHLSWDADGSLRVAIPLTLPNGCYGTGTPVAAPPTGQVGIANATALTIPVTVTGDICPQMLKDVRVEATIPAVPADTVMLVIYEDWPEGQGIKAHAHPLPAR